MKKFLVFLCGFLLFCSINAMGLNITPEQSIEIDSSYVANNSQENLVGYIFILDPTVTQVYKYEMTEVKESGNVGWYSVNIGDQKNDEVEWLAIISSATLQYTPKYLTVKDGNHSPYWYIFDLEALGWNGTETLNLSGFWPQRGAISNVALWGTTPVPEPATMLLLGSGLVGLAGFGRKKFKK